MKIILSNPRGFCAGVVRAIDTVKAALDQWGPPIYVKHQIVHNRHVVEELEKKGAIFIEDLHEVPHSSRVIYSAHGVSPEVRKIAKQRNLQEVDATCGLVTRVHSAAKRYANKGYQVILIGHRNHVEIIGTAGEAPDQTHIVESVSDVDRLQFSKEDHLFYITQTTLSIDDVKEITDRLVAKFPQVKTLPTSSICYATTNRQLALKQLTKNADLVLVVGDPNSSNSNRLKELSENHGVQSFLINDANEIQEKWLKNVSNIGLTAGASTPENIVERCIERLRQLGADHIEEKNFIEEDVFFHLPKEVSMPHRSS